MSIYRDESILKSIVGDSYTVEQSGQLHLFVLVEQNLRKIIQEAVKYQMHFRKKQLTCQEVEIAIKDQNMIKTEIMGFQLMDSINLTKRQDEYHLNDSSQDLKDLICHQLRTVRIPIGSPQLGFYNVLREYQLVNSQETQNILLLKDILQSEMKQNEEQKKSFSVIKDNVIQILSPHQQEMIKEFHKILEKEMTSLFLNYSDDFVRLLMDISIYKDVAQIIPFLAQYLYSKQEGDQLFQYKKRKIIVDCILGLCRNNKINLEFQLHQFIKILVNFLCARLDDCEGKGILELQSKTGKCLNYLIEKHSLKYNCLKQNVDQIFIQKIGKLDQKLQSLITVKRLLKMYSLIGYFHEQNISNLHLSFLEQIAAILQHIQCSEQIKNGEQLDLIYNIELQFEQMLIKIINGLPYLLQNKQQIQIIIENALELLKSLGRQESIIVLSKIQEDCYIL